MNLALRGNPAQRGPRHPVLVLPYTNSVQVLGMEQPTVHCTLYTVQCTLYTVHCKVYGVQCTLYSVHCKAYSTVPARILSADMIYRPDRTQLHGFLLQQREEGLDGAVGHLGRQLYSLQGRNCILYNVSIVFSSVSIVLSSVSIVFPPSPLPGRSIH